MASLPLPQPNIGPPGQGPVGFPGGQPGGFMPPAPPGPPNLGFDPETAPVTSEVYEIDPLVLDRPVKIKVEGASRMLSRAGLQQIWPFLSQAVLNGPFLQGLAQQGWTADFTEFMRLAQDAVGTQRLYKLFRPLSPQEQQARSQPSPDTMAKMQMAQQEGQTRQSIMAQKTQSEQAIAQIQAAIKDKEIDEKSSQKILEILQRDKSDSNNGPDPMLEAQKQQQELAMKAQEHGLNLRAKQQEHAMNLQAMQHKHGIEMLKARSMLAQGLAKAQAARMMPQKPQQRTQQ